MTSRPTYAQVVPFPLGTGNDMSRVLGWGANYAGEPIVPILQDITDGERVQMDRWLVHSEPLQDSDVQCLHVLLNSCERVNTQDHSETAIPSLASQQGERSASANERRLRKKSLSFSESHCVIPEKSATPPPNWVNKSGKPLPTRKENGPSPNKRGSKKSKKGTVVLAQSSPLITPPPSEIPLENLEPLSTIAMQYNSANDSGVESSSAMSLMEASMSSLEPSAQEILEYERKTLQTAVKNVEEENFEELSDVEKLIDEHLNSAECEIVAEQIASEEPSEANSSREPKRKNSKRTKLLHPKGDTSLPVHKSTRSSPSKRRVKTTHLEPAADPNADSDAPISNLAATRKRLAAAGLSSSAGSLPEYNSHEDVENSPQVSNSRLETSSTHKKRIRTTSDAERRRRPNRNNSVKKPLSGSTSSLPPPATSESLEYESSESVPMPTPVIPTPAPQLKMADYAIAESTSALSPSAQRKATHKNLVMNNYFSIGVDSMVALDFHLRREQSPGLFPHHVINKAWYGLYGLKHAMLNLSKKPDLRRVLRLTLDGSEITIPRGVEAIVFLQIPSYSSGTNLWGDYNKAKGQRSQPSVSDGLFEVVALKGVMHLGALQAGWSSGIRLGQAREATIHTVCVVPAQCDGEPWLLPACKTTISFYKQSTMLFNYTRSSPKRFTAVTGLQPPNTVDPESEYANHLRSSGKSEADSSEEATKATLWTSSSAPSSSMLTNTPVTPNELRHHIRRPHVPSRSTDLRRNPEDFPKRVLASRCAVSSVGSRSAPDSSADSESHSTSDPTYINRRGDSTRSES